MSECGQFHMVIISDCNGAYVLRYLRLCDGRFFGGNTWDRVDGFESGVHVMRDLKGMLGLVGAVANSPGVDKLPYSIESERGWARIGREMSAPDLAKILGCDDQAVRDYFAPLVSLNVKPDGETTDA